ncbi:carbonic anhydrase [Arenibaculum sp.]|jgi:carbonic anhydrase|uniref:carbonic anhydrase n=1 Tax=Arenibaculum sp. TaxID=2865862 RepID=UPI002E118943|nr:carbonic anhydrase [Arenibaculum sp.]
MKRLIEGFRRFRESYDRDHRQVFEELAERGQSPSAMVVACSDSRVDPQLIFGAGPGEIFVVRNVANLIPPYAPDGHYHGTSAALEFAVLSLQVPNVIVLGHARCGGIGALLERGDEARDDFVSAWMHIARPARDRALAAAGGEPAQAQHLCEHEAIKVSLDNLLTFPWVRERVEGGTLRLHGWYFDIVTGAVTALGPHGTFEPL